MDSISPGQYALVSNAFSLTIAVMGAATAFFFLSRSQVAPPYRTAMTVTGLVTLIALYHYVRIFASWEGAYTLVDGTMRQTGAKFNDAYRYVDWLLTVPLLLVELILVMRLSGAETRARATKLGLLGACRTWGAESVLEERRSQKWTAAVDLQPAIPSPTGCWLR